MTGFSYNCDKIHVMELEAGKHIAPIYDDVYETLFYETVREMVAKTVLRKGRETIRLLDLGCGTGNLTKFFSGMQHCAIFAVDISPDMLRVARDKLKNVKFLLCDVEHLPFRDNSFDAVVGFSILHHLPDLGRLFDEIWRVSRHNASFVFGEPAESFLHKHKTLFRALKLPFYPLYLLVKKKNLKRFDPNQYTWIDTLLGPQHRNLSEKEIVDSVSKENRARMFIQFKRLGILIPRFGTVFLKQNRMDRLLFRWLWLVDLVLSRMLPKCTFEIIIEGVVRKRNSPS